MDRPASRPGSTATSTPGGPTTRGDRSAVRRERTYRYHPYDPDDEVVRGREAIVRDWVEPEGKEDRDEAGTYDSKYEPYAVDGDRAVAVGWSRYWTDASKSTLDETYHNVYLMRFDGDGRCVDFTEYFMKTPDATG